MVKIKKEPRTTRCPKCKKFEHYVARGVSTGKDPATGRRTQRTITGCTMKAVEAEVRRISVAVDNGTYRKPWDGPVPELISAYLSNGARNWEANTRLSYAGALAPAAEWFAAKKARSVTHEDVVAYRDHLADEGRRRGGKAGTALSARSVNLSLGQLQAAYDLAERTGRIARNPVRWVDRIKSDESERITWSEDQVRRFIATAGADRLAACWLLSLLGLRRGEVLGLKWSDISLSEGTVTVRRARVLVGGQVIEKSPKSRRGRRTLPLFGLVSQALEALYAQQGAELAAAGAAYAAGSLDDCYVCADELGAPVHPERYSDEFARLSLAAGLPACRLHDCRHSVSSLLEHAGVSDSIRAAWFGHTIAVNRGTYTHASAADLAAVSGALSDIFSAA